MPWMVPSHQAVVLPLKLWRPAWFSGLALCLGALAPDLWFVLQVSKDSTFSHALGAQLTFTVPVVLLLHPLFAHLVLPWLVPLLPKGAPLHLEELRAVRKAVTRADWLRVAFSAWIGGLSHLLLDGFTHGDGWAVPYLPLLARRIAQPWGAAPLHDVLQLWLTVLLGALAAVLWRRLAAGGRLWGWRRERPTGWRRAPRPVRSRVLGWLAACALAGAAFAAVARSMPTRAIAIELVSFGVVTFAAAGLVLAAAVDKLRGWPVERQPSR